MAAYSDTPAWQSTVMAAHGDTVSTNERKHAYSTTPEPPIVLTTLNTYKKPQSTTDESKNHFTLKEKEVRLWHPDMYQGCGGGNS